MPTPQPPSVALRRPPALYAYPEQPCWMSSLQGGRMVFDPEFLGLDHGIENGEQFANGRDEGDLFGFADCAQVPVESANHRVVAGGGQGGHVQGSAHLGAASPHSALASELATVAVERGHADEDRDLAAVQLARVPLYGRRRQQSLAGGELVQHPKCSWG